MNMATTFMLSLAALGIACGAPELATGPPPPGQKLGYIKTYGDMTAITVPETAAVGDTVTVTVSTVGNTCYALGDTRVTQDGLSVTIEPFDRWAGPGVVCLDILVNMLHVAAFVFTAPGTATVSIYGLAQPSENVVKVEREIRVTP